MRAAAALAALLLAGSCGNGTPETGERLARAIGLPAEVVAVCGDPSILGEALAPQSGAGRCGIAAPVRVHAVGAIRLSPAAKLNCEAAQALKRWSETGARAAASAAGKRITGLKVAASYACRARNNHRGGRLSEHARGNAIDISEFAFADGSRASVLADWSGSDDSALLQRLHQVACGPFGVVLGPKVDRHHRDHFHFDVSNLDRRYCR